MDKTRSRAASNNFLSVTSLNTVKHIKGHLIHILLDSTNIKTSYSLDMRKKKRKRSLLELKPTGTPRHFKYLPEFNTLALSPVSTGLGA